MQKIEEEVFLRMKTPPTAIILSGLWMVDDLVQALLSVSSHQDVLAVDGTVGGARQAVDFVKSSPICSDIKAVIVDGSKGLSDPAQDAYLKICEEPPSMASIAIIVDDHGKLRPALLSRMNVFRKILSTAADVDLASSASRGDDRKKDAILSKIDDMTELYEMARQISFGAFLEKTPKVIAEWSKLEDNEKRAALGVIRQAYLQGGKKAWATARFAETMLSTPSANAEIHWWRACL